MFPKMLWGYNDKYIFIPLKLQRIPDTCPLKLDTVYGVVSGSPMIENPLQVNSVLTRYPLEH